MNLILSTPLDDVASGDLEWRADVDAVAWDRSLAYLSGHPLQSAAWGDARRVVDGIRDHRWMALHGSTPVWMARIEERRLPVVGWVGWVPKGPSGAFSASVLPTALKQHLKAAGMILFITDKWAAVKRDVSPSSNRPRTIWVDLSSGKDRVWDAFEKRFRWSVRRATKAGITVRLSRTLADIDGFYSLCSEISRKKRFQLPGSLALMKSLLAKSGEDVESQLFLCRRDEKLLAGALILRCGRTIHYLWGGTNREASQQGAAPAVHWSAIQWAIERGCTRYDLEGIDPLANPGTFAFKKKFGGTEITLEGKRYFPVGLRGGALSLILRHR